MFQAHDFAVPLAEVQKLRDSVTLTGWHFSVIRPTFSVKRRPPPARLDACCLTLQGSCPMSAQDAMDIVTATHFVTWTILPLELAATFPSKSVEESSTALLVVFPSNLVYETFGKLSTFAHGANSRTTGHPK
jgi:hypothetical protein